VCESEITHCVQTLSGVLFAFIVKNFSQSNLFTLAPLLMLLTNMRYADILEKGNLTPDQSYTKHQLDLMLCRIKVWLWPAPELKMKMNMKMIMKMKEKMMIDEDDDR